MVPPLALHHVEQQLQHIAQASARAREDIDRLFDAATAPVAPAESEDASLPDLASPRKTPPEPLGLHLLPEDLSAICAGYLRVADVVTYSACSEATREWYESEEPWEGFLEPLCLRESWWFGLQDDEDDDESSPRAKVLHHAFSLRLARRFLGSAPLLASNAGTGHGRAAARPLLAACAGLTATEALALRSGREPPTLIAQALARGAIEPLLSLARTEAKNFSALASCVLANVIAVAEMHERLLGVPVYTGVSHFLEVLGGRRKLWKLLTSPSASVAQTRTLTDALRVDLVREEVSGAALEAIQDAPRQTCQGSASKHAARVLCNWDFPEQAIASPGDDMAGVSLFPRLIAALASTDKWTLYNMSADSKSVVSVCVVSLKLDAAGKITGAGTDERAGAVNIEQFTLKGGVEPKASMISMSAFYSSFGPSSVGHYSYCLWADGVSDDIDGFFGIWEQASHDPHFELRRGGHCRCLPGDHTAAHASMSRFVNN
jgi:hypothetical protein